MGQRPNDHLPRQWRMKAEECRTVSDQMCDPRSRDSYRRMAESYDRLADAWERKARQQGAKPAKAG